MVQTLSKFYYWGLHLLIFLWSSQGHICRLGQILEFFCIFHLHLLMLSLRSIYYVFYLSLSLGALQQEEDWVITGYSLLFCLIEIWFFCSGKRVLSDAWALDTAQKPYRWQKLNPEGDRPSARMWDFASFGSISWKVKAVGPFSLCYLQSLLGSFWAITILGIIWWFYLWKVQHGSG